MDNILLKQGTTWNAEASQELLRLRFRQLRDLFDKAQTVVEEREAWDVVASTLSSKSDYGLQVDAVKCRDQLIKLRQQWQKSSRNQLQLMMDECFRKDGLEFQQHQSIEQPLPAKEINCNLAMEEALMQEVKTKIYQVLPKKRKKTEVEQQEEEVSVLPPTCPVPLAQVKTLSSPEPVPTVPEPASSDLDHRLLPASIAVFPQPVPSTSQETLSTVVSVEKEEEEFHRHGEIMRALEKRSQQLESLAQSHKHLAEVTQQLMDALVNRTSG